MDAVEKFIADQIAKFIGATKPETVALVESLAPKVVDTVLSTIAVYQAVRAEKAAK